MESNGIDKLTKELMTNSRLNLINPEFDKSVMNQILSESNRQESRKHFLVNILIFGSIELVIFTILFILLNYFPVAESLNSTMKNSMYIFQKIGEFAIHYDYLILSFIVVAFLDLIMTKRGTTSMKPDFRAN